MLRLFTGNITHRSGRHSHGPSPRTSVRKGKRAHKVLDADQKSRSIGARTEQQGGLQQHSRTRARPTRAPRSARSKQQAGQGRAAPNTQVEPQGRAWDHPLGCPAAWGWGRADRDCRRKLSLEAWRECHSLGQCLHGWAYPAAQSPNSTLVSSTSSADGDHHHRRRVGDWVPTSFDAALEAHTTQPAQIPIAIVQPRSRFDQHRARCMGRPFQVRTDESRTTFGGIREQGRCCLQLALTQHPRPQKRAMQLHRLPMTSTGRSNPRNPTPPR